MARLLALLKKLVRRLWEMGAFLTAIGAALIPLGVILILEAPSESSPIVGQVGLGVILLGVVLILFGCVKIIAEGKQRRREGMVLLGVLTGIADKLGVNIDEVLKTVRRKIDGK